MATRGKHVKPAFTTKPEAEFVREPVVGQSEPKPVECPNCSARLVVKIAGGDAALDIARCQQCGKQYKLEAGKLLPYMEYK